MKISEYILNINSPSPLLFRGSLSRLGLSAFGYAHKNPAVCAQNHVSVRRFIMAATATMMMKSQKSLMLNEDEEGYFIFVWGVRSSLPEDNISPFSIYSHFRCCSMPLLYYYPQIALLTRWSHARARLTFTYHEKKNPTQ